MDVLASFALSTDPLTRSKFFSNPAFLGSEQEFKTFQMIASDDKIDPSVELDDIIQVCIFELEQRQNLLKYFPIINEFRLEDNEVREKLWLEIKKLLKSTHNSITIVISNLLKVLYQDGSDQDLIQNMLTYKLKDTLEEAIKGVWGLFYKIDFQGGCYYGEYKCTGIQGYKQIDDELREVLRTLSRVGRLFQTIYYIITFLEYDIKNNFFFEGKTRGVMEGDLTVYKKLGKHYNRTEEKRSKRYQARIQTNRPGIISAAAFVTLFKIEKVNRPTNNVVLEKISLVNKEEENFKSPVSKTKHNKTFLIKFASREIYTFNGDNLDLSSILTLHSSLKEAFKYIKNTELKAFLIRRWINHFYKDFNEFFACSIYNIILSGYTQYETRRVIDNKKDLPGVAIELMKIPTVREIYILCCSRDRTEFLRKIDKVKSLRTILAVFTVGSADSIHVGNMLMVPTTNGKYILSRVDHEEFMGVEHLKRIEKLVEAINTSNFELMRDIITEVLFEEAHVKNLIADEENFTKNVKNFVYKSTNFTEKERYLYSKKRPLSNFDIYGYILNGVSDEQFLDCLMEIFNPEKLIQIKELYKKYESELNVQVDLDGKPINFKVFEAYEMVLNALNNLKQPPASRLNDISNKMNFSKPMRG